MTTTLVQFIQEAQDEINELIVEKSLEYSKHLKQSKENITDNDRMFWMLHDSALLDWIEAEGINDPILDELYNNA